MSLRYQINLRIFLLSLSVLLLGGSIAVWQARTAVNQEINSSIQLAVKLIQFGFAHTSAQQNHSLDWLPRLNALEEIRHLSVQLTLPTGQTLHFSRPIAQSQSHTPPQWFIRLVRGESIKTQHPIMLKNGEQLMLSIEANPLDEISEVWKENIAFFSSFALLMLLSFLAVNVVFNKTLKSITTIVEALNVIATGHYQQKLPDFAIAEYDSIAKAINQLADKLHSIQQENRALTQHSLAIQEDERRRLAQELHDELGQSLTAIKVMAGTAARPNANLAQTTTVIMNTCDHLISVVRSMMQQLHPLVLTELGLKASLEDLVQHWLVRYPELTITLHCPDEVDDLAQDHAIQLFRVIQECLTNIIRHAHASRADIRLAMQDDSLQLTVSDNGQGCSDEDKTGFGLRGMAERINSLGGELRLYSEQRRGMTVQAEIPL